MTAYIQARQETERLVITRFIELALQHGFTRQGWTGTAADCRALARGLVHLASADAHQHANVLLTGTMLPRRFVDEPSKPEY